ncbi:hypothetical protein LSTR_LSTR005263 [Laodelphax striatellus]|uniref:Uncharacterized protein n=1 Tax=Laodelphax striatellus TaxID=195883 RepID=A0A482X917_LAOST|nr:hypothetical protein LSTR_LSTR005263 [Laodelphax striatellus]
MDIFNVLNKPTTSQINLARGPMFDKKWLRNRELGFTPKIGTQDNLMHCLYSSVIPCNTWDHNKSVQSAVPGGIFNLEFSPDGSMLVAACEKKSILMFDPLSRNLIRAIDNAHNDCVNCVRFLDSRVFATCSDDNTVALWDARNLKSRIRTLHGHSNWVKNIEFSQNDGLLVTSGFDGSIFTWDINSYSESQYSYNRGFHTNGLMRTRLNHVASKMIICTTGGYLIVIHNLDLKTLEKDMIGFKPNMYRLMQLSQTTIPVVACYTKLFSKHRKTNRLEFITDFPEGDEAEVVSSLQVHPQGWCALSRNINNDESTEWTCIHDIQEREEIDTDSEIDEMSDDDANGTRADGCASAAADGEEGARSGENVAEGGGRPNAEREREMAHRRVRSVSGYYFRGFPTSEAGEPTIETDNGRVAINTDIWEALIAIREVRSQRERERLDAVYRANGGEILVSNALETRMRVVRMSSGLPDFSNSRIGIGGAGSRRERLIRQRMAEAAAAMAAASSDSDSGLRDPAEGGAAVSQPRVTTITYNFMRYGRRRRYRQGSGSGSSGETQSGSDERGASGAAATADSDAGTMRRMRSHAVVILGGSGSGSGADHSRLQQMVMSPYNYRDKHNTKHKIHENVPRLTHYIQEPNLGKGFIKELCFSSDGRLICSPFGYGVRLLAFSPQCAELSSCVPPEDRAIKLHEIGTNICHSDIVVSTKFSPRHCLLVSGCLSGRIVWHQPVIQK